jgi:hypothetical protein
MLKKIKYALIVTLLIGGIYSCVKKKTYSQSPEIGFKDFIPFTGDSADMVISFSDGDGDIGREAGDSAKNLWMNYYYKDTLTGKYRLYYDASSNDSLRTGYIIRKPTDNYEGKPISGEVAVRISKFRHSKKIKNFKYVIYMIDNGGNRSNVVTTPELLVP